MNGNWTESESRIIDLSDDEPEVFALYLNLIYKNVLPTMDLTEKEFGALPPVDIVMHIDKEYTTLFKLYILAEKLQDDLTKDEAITAVFQLSQVRAGRKICIEPAPETVKLVYNATPQCSPSRLLCVDIWKVGSRDLMEIWRMRFPKEFLFDLAMAYRHELLEASENVTNRKDVTAFLEATKKSQEQKTHPEGKSTSLKSP
ncbi:hypothetical protein N0V95_008185 [Ascochyta clinopodiicola]|nr:hypothetical protein N0V95_008185 [Ascochyta clinopodiicola]